MKALIVNPVDREINLAEVENLEQIIKIIGFETVIADDIDATGDKLYFDEECFLRGASGRFQLDKLVPVSGKGVIVGSSADGSMADLASDVEQLKSRIQFIA